ncbi:putative membrane protein [Bosea sp. OAE506]|uniref:DUF2934 domain-containing protein n=1 Tax=Bosea sp. OAE506 TaxID=2663870 RepID=UPI00178B1237
MSREQTVRDVAYAIWEAEGKPQGRDAQHWRMAEERVAAGTGKDASAKDAGTKAKATAKSPAKGPAKSPSPSAAPAKGKAAPAKATETAPAKAKPATSKK